MPRIEYRIYDTGVGVNCDNVYELDHLGAQGWQLVAIVEYAKIMNPHTPQEWSHTCQKWYFSRWTMEPLSEDHVERMGQVSPETVARCWPPLSVPISEALAVSSPDS